MKKYSKHQKALEFARSDWDQPHRRGRAHFRKVIGCGTEAGGYAVVASETEEKKVFHTCKDKACISCGNRATLNWQRAQKATLPDMRYIGIVLTMPREFWSIFQTNSTILNRLPAVGAVAIEQWAWNRYHVRLHVIVVMHTFGGHLNFFPHLHMMVSAEGLNPSTSAWVRSMVFDHLAIRDSWTFALTLFLETSYDAGQFENPAKQEFSELLLKQSKRKWNIKISNQMSKYHFVSYGGRYVRRPPLLEKNILSVTSDKVVYLAKDTISGLRVRKTCHPIEYARIVEQHIPTRYSHSMRYFGLLAPRSKHLLSHVVYRHLDQEQCSPPKPLSWQFSILRDFGYDPLIDSSGQPMRWARNVKSDGRVQPTD